MFTYSSTGERSTGDSADDLLLNSATSTAASSVSTSAERALSMIFSGAAATKRHDVLCFSRTRLFLDYVAGCNLTYPLATQGCET